jgi:hypothetical protein
MTRPDRSGGTSARVQTVILNSFQDQLLLATGFYSIMNCAD